jgi:CMP-N-acetylneuraminic acid synthetase
VRFRRQELQTVHALNGAIYLVTTRVLMEKQTFYTERTFAYPMPSERSVDIECAWDFRLAELLLQDQNTLKSV